MANKLIDLTQPISKGMTRYPLLPEVDIEPLRTRLHASILHLGSHVGTHIDAPAHMGRGGERIGDLPLERFCRTAVVSSVSKGPGEVISLEDVRKGGPTPEAGETLIIHTGFSKHFDTLETYDDHPWLDVEVAHWAVDLGLSMVGVDMFSPDQPIHRREDNDNFTYPIHSTLLLNGVLITENLTNLEQISGQRGRLYSFPVVALEPGGDAGHARFVWESLGDHSR